jgi:hypothetical protein
MVHVSINIDLTSLLTNYAFVRVKKKKQPATHMICMML